MSTNILFLKHKIYLSTKFIYHRDSKMLKYILYIFSGCIITTFLRCISKSCFRNLSKIALFHLFYIYPKIRIAQSRACIDRICIIKGLWSYILALHIPLLTKIQRLTSKIRDIAYYFEFLTSFMFSIYSFKKY